MYYIFLRFLYKIGGVMDRIIIMDFENGSEVYIPISEFLKQGFIDALVFQRDKEINLTALIRTIQEKAKTRYKKSAYIRFSVENETVEIKLPKLAKDALFSYSSSEIEQLFLDPMLKNELEGAVASCLPDDLRPSTSAQRTLALRIADVIGVNIGFDLLSSKQKLSVFIAQNQHELDSYERDTEGYEIVSDRISDALIMYFQSLNSWSSAFDVSFSMYLQLPERGRNLVNMSLQSTLSDHYWNVLNDEPEYVVVANVLKKMAFKYNKKQKFSEQFKKIHLEYICVIND